jgi:hypothetical protein
MSSDFTVPERGRQIDHATHSDEDGQHCAQNQQDGVELNLTPCIRNPVRHW